MTSFLPLLASAAHALGGAFVGPDATDVPSSAATLVVVAVEGDRSVVTVTAQAATELADAAYLWPAPGLDRASLASPEPEGLEHLEAFTRPRVEEVTCDELVETLRYRTPPGCASYEVVIPEPDLRGEDAADSVGIRLAPLPANPDLVVVEAVDLDDWLVSQGLELPVESRTALQPWVDDGVPFVYARLTARIAEGAWLPPIRFAVDGAEVDLPLTAGALSARTNHELTVLTIGRDVGDPTVANYPREAVLDECMLPPATGAEAWWDTELDAFRGAAVPPWIPVFAGPADRCQPCAEEPLTVLDLVDLGLQDALPEDMRVGRLVLRYAPGALDEDPHVDFAAPRVDTTTRWIARTDGLGFAFETCDGGFDPDDVCAEIQLPGSGGCAVPPRASVGAVLLVLLALFRRRSVPLLLLWVPLAADAAPDRSPRTEAHATLGLLGTNRVRLEPGSGGPPGLRSPFVGVEGRWSAVALKDGVSLGLIGAVRAWRGRAPDDPTRFGFVEPSAGLDVRHGRMREGYSWCPYGRYGARVAVPVLDPSVTGPFTAVGSMFHLGAGAWLGRGPTRPSVELRGTVLPRTDGYVTSFHPATGLTGWTFFPGAANIELVVGVGVF